MTVNNESEVEKSTVDELLSLKQLGFTDFCVMQISSI